MNNTLCGTAWNHMEAVPTFRVSFGACRLHTITQNPTHISLMEEKRADAAAQFCLTWAVRLVVVICTLNCASTRP